MIRRNTKQITSTLSVHPKNKVYCFILYHFPFICYTYVGDKNSFEEALVLIGVDIARTLKCDLTQVFI